jgi:hypothetical protein
MKAIIECLDNYLAINGLLNINPVEANAILAKAGLLQDSRDRPGKPLRELLRKGSFPHAYQVGGKGSSWAIPHSGYKSMQSITEVPLINKTETPKVTYIVPDSIIVDILQLEKVLMDDNRFLSAGSIDQLVPHSSGFYCIRIIDINKLPTPFNNYLTDRRHDIVYIGIATESLNKRFLNQELRANGHGTFFRSIGALLGFLPLKGSLTSKKNKRNYRFSPSDQKEIIKWINVHLKVNWIEFNGDFKTLEAELIRKHKPLVNLDKNPLALKELSDLRKKCVRIANEF